MAFEGFCMSDYRIQGATGEWETQDGHTIAEEAVPEGSWEVRNNFV